MTEEAGLSAEEFDGWIPAAEALRMFGARPVRATMRMIADRLVSGLLRSAAHHAFYRGLQQRAFSELEDVIWSYWAYEADDHFWASGDTRVPIDSVDGVMPGYEYNLMDVRFDPDGLREMGAVGLPERGGIAHFQQPDALAEPADSRRDLPRVPDPALTRWYEFWAATYPPEMQNHETALAHALATFPKNSVARSRIRDLRGTQKPGPKATAE